MSAPPTSSESFRQHTVVHRRVAARTRSRLTVYELGSGSAEDSLRVDKLMLMLSSTPAAWHDRLRALQRVGFIEQLVCREEPVRLLTALASARDHRADALWTTVYDAVAQSGWWSAETVELLSGAVSSLHKQSRADPLVDDEVRLRAARGCELLLICNSSSEWAAGGTSALAVHTSATLTLKAHLWALPALPKLVEEWILSNNWRERSEGAKTATLAVKRMCEGLEPSEPASAPDSARTETAQQRRDRLVDASGFRAAGRGARASPP